jgi:multiple antibiotic resistance protein
MLDHILYSSAALIALTAPLVELPIFLAIVDGYSVAQKRMAACKVAIGVLIILFSAAIFGSEALLLFGVSLPAFRTAAGFLLICIGFQMLHGELSFALGDTAAGTDRNDQLLVPFVMPLTAGPGPIVATITLSIREDGRLLGLPVGTLIAISIATLIILTILLIAVPLQRVLSPRFARITERFLGVVLVAIGFQMGMSGVREFFLG